MAFLREGSPDSEKGVWVQAGVDAENGLPIKLRVRRVPDWKVRAIRDAYGTDQQIQEPVKIKGKDGKFVDSTVTYVTRLLSTEENRCILRDKAAYALTDCENLIVIATDEPKAKAWASLLGGATEIKPNEPNILDGHLTEAFKKYLLDNDWSLVNFVNEEADKQGEKTYGKEAKLGKTSAAGSSSV
jgi:hypothetical protein